MQHSATQEPNWGTVSLNVLNVLLIATPTLHNLHGYGRHKLIWVIYIQQSKLKSLSENISWKKIVHLNYASFKKLFSIPWLYEETFILVYKLTEDFRSANDPQAIWVHSYCYCYWEIALFLWIIRKKNIKLFNKKALERYINFPFLTC